MARQRLSGIAFAPDTRDSKRIGYSLEHVCVRVFSEGERLAASPAELQGSVQAAVAPVHFFALMQAVSSLFVRRQTALQSRMRLMAASMSKLSALELSTASVDEQKRGWQTAILKQDAVVQVSLHPNLTPPGCHRAGTTWTQQWRVPAPLFPATRCPPSAELTQSVAPGAQQLLVDVGRRTTEVEGMRAALKRDESEAAAAAARLQETRAQLEEAMGQVSSGIPPCRG